MDKKHLMNDVLPDVPFIAVFGSSHTYGSCKMNDMNMIDLDRKDIWASKIGDKFQLPVINFGYPGVTNQILIQQLLDFVVLEKSKNCVFVIIEVRMGERVFMLSNDIATPLLESEIIDDIYSELMYGKHMREIFSDLKIGSKTISMHYLTRIPAMLTKDKNKSIENVLNAKMYANKDVIPSNLIDSIEIFKNLYIEYKFGYAGQYIEDFNNIKVMKSVLDLSGIKSFWFCFDNVYSGHIGREEYEFLIEKYEQTGTCNIFDHEIKSLRDGATKSYVNEVGTFPPTCDCGHYTSEFHTWVAEKVYEEIKDIMC